MSTPIPHTFQTPFGPARQQGTPDGRFTVALEYVGYPKPRHVLRFCGDMVSHHPTRQEAALVTDTTPSDFHAALYQTLTRAFYCGRTPTLVKLGPDAWEALITTSHTELEFPKSCSLSRMQTPGIAVFTQPFTLAQQI